jgi:DNA-binding CsgD family transcriptional regulator
MVGDSWAVSLSLNILGDVLLQQGDLAAARRLLEEGVALQRQMGERFVLAHSLDALGQVALAEGHCIEAGTVLCEGLRLRQDLGDPSGIADTLESVAALAAADKQPERAVQPSGAAAGVRESIGARLSPMGRARLDQWLVRVRQILGEESIRSAWEAGHAISVAQAVELAFAATQAPPSGSNRTSDRSGQRVADLTLREKEVATLLAHRLTNRQITERLVITERTVGAHIGHILDKLGFNSRHQVGVWAAEHGLL